MNDNSYTIEQIRVAFENHFLNCGEIWFPYKTKRWIRDVMRTLGCSKEEAEKIVDETCDNVVDIEFKGFIQKLKETRK